MFSISLSVHLLLMAGGGVVGWFGLTSELQAEDFVHDVVPVLKRNCVHCHGGLKAEGDFSLNTRETVVESGHVDLDSPEDSYLLELITSSDPGLQMPPPDRPRMSEEEIGVLRRWVEGGVKWDSAFSFEIKTYEPPLRPREVELPAARDGRHHPVDRLLDRYLLERQLPDPPTIDDETFLRRVSLDLVGLLPSEEQRDAFLSDQNPNKRSELIESLLNDEIRYADHWMTFFNDLLRNDYSGTGFITGGRKQISVWLYQSLRTNKPFDVMVRELVAPPTPDSQGFIDGIKWRGDVSAGQTLPIQFSQSISQSFLGINMKCASCHDSFVDRWKLTDAYGLAAIYADRKLELHRCDKPTGETAQAAWLFPELGQVDPQAPRAERLEQLAGLLTHPENGRFARTIVNRLWYQLMGRGIVHPLDAMQNEPWNEDLLDYLAVEFVRSHYDLKAMLRLIATSTAYQSRSEVADETGAGKTYLYRGPRAKRMTAEQFLDNVWRLTGTAPTESDVPVERQSGQSGEIPMIRASLKKNTALMKSLGRPMREQIVSMRPDRMTTLEAIDLANEPTLANAFAEGAVRLIKQNDGNPERIVRTLFRSALCREPTERERVLLTGALGNHPAETSVQDAMWAVCMLPEFILIR
ncbi:MAG: DUF1553 domain-containing protein [Phycisphaera sp. RhM]|nr:DUF1553 domain-containing protein [Phycisphaera sp. RhM]